MSLTVFFRLQLWMAHSTQQLGLAAMRALPLKEHNISLCPLFCILLMFYTGVESSMNRNAKHLAHFSEHFSRSVGKNCLLSRYLSHLIFFLSLFIFALFKGELPWFGHIWLGCYILKFLPVLFLKALVIRLEYLICCIFFPITIFILKPWKWLGL